jgi:hypothetical protein
MPAGYDQHNAGLSKQKVAMEREKRVWAGLMKRKQD